MTTRTTTEPTAAIASHIHPDAEPLEPGRRVGSWRIERLLGAGGMGDVYAVVHAEIGKRAALKVMHRRLSFGLHAERVVLEGQVVNRVDHPNIVDIFDSGTVDGRPYLVMQRLEGVTLGHLAAAGRMTPGLVIEILLQMCDALGAAHAANIVHRDLKPDNIFLVSTGAITPQVKLLDWGIAKVIDDSERRTMQGQLIGTPDYLAPEQACGRAITPATDVYALGVIAYQLFVGCRPFAATTAQDMLTMHVRDAPVRPHLMWPEIPERLEDLLLAMLEKDPVARPRVQEVARQLGHTADELFHSCTPDPIDDDEDARKTTGFAPTLPSMSSRQERRRSDPGPRLLAAGVIILAALASTSVPTNIGASQVPVQVLPVPATPRLVIPPPTPTTAPAPELAPPATKPQELPTVVEPPPAAKRQSRGPRAQPVRPVAVVEVSAVPADPSSSSEVIARYVSIGRELAASKRVIDTSDLWTKYRLLRIYEALRSQQQREHAVARLGEIQEELSKRVNAVAAK